MSVNKIIIAAKASVSGLGFIMDLYERHTAGCTKIRPRRFCLGYSVADIDKQSKLLCDMKAQQSTSPTPITHTQTRVIICATHNLFNPLGSVRVVRRFSSRRFGLLQEAEHHQRMLTGKRWPQDPLCSPSSPPTSACVRMLARLKRNNILSSPNPTGLPFYLLLSSSLVQKTAHLFLVSTGMLKVNPRQT